MFCEICQERESTIHTAHIAGITPKHSNLCDKCFEASKATQARDLAAALQAGCRYCGGKPYGGGTDAIARMSGIHKMSFMCKACATEHSRFLSQKLPGLGGEIITPEQVLKVHTLDVPVILIEADEYMRKWVATKNLR
jgi:protein-arginine kinase activator protein McsA